LESSHEWGHLFFQVFTRTVQGDRYGARRGAELFRNLGVVEVFEIPQNKDFCAATAEVCECGPQVVLELPTEM